MRNITKTLLLALMLAVGAGVNSTAQHVILDGTASVKVYKNIQGTTIDSLITDPKYPDSPDATDTLNFIEYPKGNDSGGLPPGNVDENYGAVITGLITVDLDGDYVFYMASDDNGQFWLSTDSDVANATQIAAEPGWNPVRSYQTDAGGARTPGAPENVSAPIHLLKNTKYAFQAFLKEGGGGDNLAVAARLAGDQPAPDGSVPIFNAAVSSNVKITSQPKGAAVAVGGTATFTVGTSVPAFYQWLKNGSPIAGASSASYTTDPVATGDNGTKYSVKVTAADGSTETSVQVNLAVVGTRQYTIGGLEFDTWVDADCACAPDLPTVYTYFGTPFGSFSAGGGFDPNVTMPVAGFDSRLGYPDDTVENYTGAMFGYFIPDQTGNYYFHIKSDDPGQLFFNPNGQAIPDPTVDANADGVPDFRVANESGCCNPFQNAGAAQTGGPFSLQAGQKYGILGMWHDITGGDYLQVAFTRDGVATGLSSVNSLNPSTIPGQYLGSLKPFAGPELAIGEQPQTIHVEDKRTGTFTLTTSAAPGITYQWQSAPAGSSTFTDINGATGSSLAVAADLASNNNSQYRVKVHAEGQDLTSDIATLIVDPDVTGPRIISASTAPNLDAIVVNFNEAVTATGAAFTLTGGATAGSAEAASPTVLVVHTTAPLAANTSYTLTANGIKDVSGNALTPNTVTFTSGKIFTPSGTMISGKVVFERYDGATQATIQDRIDNGPPPEVYALLDTFQQAAGQADNFASRKYGWFIPPSTGSYVFFVASDDDSSLYLSTDADPANKKLIASEASWSNDLQWTTPGGGNSTAADKRSDKFSGTQWPGGSTIVLVGGEPYYIEQRHHEGGGGDNGAATFKLASEADPAGGSASRITGNAIEVFLPADQVPPIIDTPPVGKNFNKGENVTLSVTAHGAAPLSYQWFKNKTAIAGATSSSYTINNADATAVGDYSVRIVNVNGTAETFLSDNSARLIMNGVTLDIEAEDFNYEGGKTIAAASTMPYAGGAYKGLKGTVDVDFYDSTDQAGGAAFAYNRFSTADAGNPVAEMKGPNDPPDYNRGSFTVTENYGIGWSAAAHWQNYTRTFPKGKYYVVAGTAHDGLVGLDRLDGNGPLPDGNGITDFPVYMTLSKVANPTIADGSSVVDLNGDGILTDNTTAEGGAQGLTKLGIFRSPGTGAWSSNDLVPLTDDTGAIIQIDLDGATTLRVTFTDPTIAGVSGTQDADFYLFYCADCAAVPAQPVISTSRNGNQLTITWINGGTLEYTDALTGATTVWTSTNDSDGSFTATADQAHRFYRVRQ